MLSGTCRKGYIKRMSPNPSTSDKRPLRILLLENDRANQFSRRLLQPVVIARCRVILQHTRIDWTALGYSENDIDELVEFLLRIIQSMVIAPADPPRTGPQLRAYLRRWIGPALNSRP